MFSEETGTVRKQKHDVFFRAGKVIYWFLFAFILLIAAFGGYLYRPMRVIDSVVVSCSSGGRFNAEGASVYFYSDSEVVSSYDDENLRVFCSDTAGGDRWLRPTGYGGSRWVLKSDMTQAEKKAIPKNYSLSFNYKIQNSVVDAAMVFSIVLLAGVLILEIVKRTLLYIFTGKKFI